MTDNRTMNEQLLRKLLEERGIEYTESQDRFRTRFRFNYCEACSDYLNEIEVMGACITASKSYLTPEQAIAATLGNKCATHGILTTEQVRKAIERHSSWVIGTINCFYFNDGVYEAIADELNTAMGGVNPDGLPYGLTVSNNGDLLNWRGENYIRQSTSMLIVQIDDPRREGETE